MHVADLPHLPNLFKAHDRSFIREEEGGVLVRRRFSLGEHHIDVKPLGGDTCTYQGYYFQSYKQGMGVGWEVRLATGRPINKTHVYRRGGCYPTTAEAQAALVAHESQRVPDEPWPADQTPETPSPVEVETSKAATHRAGRRNLVGEARRAAGLTQVRLAQMAGISLRGLQFLESGTYSPTLDVALRISRSVGIPAEELWPLPADNAGEQLATGRSV